MPLAFAAAAGLFVFLPGPTGGAVEAPLFAIGADAAWQHFPAASALEPILPELLEALCSHGVLTRFARNALGGECDHAGVEIANNLGGATLVAPQLLDGGAACQTFLRPLLLQLRPWEGVLYLVELADVAGVLLSACVEFAFAGPVRPMLAMHADGAGDVGAHLLPLFMLEVV